MDSRLRFTIPIVWHFVREVRQRLAEALADQSEELREASVMAASELVENAVKYGESVPGAPDATIELFVDGERIQIVVTNGLRSAADAQELESHLERIATASDPAALYMERLRRLLDDPDARGRLGLYRIGFEAGFDLRCAHEDGVLTITATRGIS